jgi:hypothetical protein
MHERVRDTDTDDRADEGMREEAGSPRYQVPRFHRIAAINSANTMAKPALLPTWRISSTGRSEMMPNATAPLESRTPKKLSIPE